MNVQRCEREGEAGGEDHQIELARFHVTAVDVGDRNFLIGGDDLAQLVGDLHDLAVKEVQADDGAVGRDFLACLRERRRVPHVSCGGGDAGEKRKRCKYNNESLHDFYRCLMQR